MLSVYTQLLQEVNLHLTRALEALEEVPPGVFVDPKERLQLQELIARAGGIVASELVRGDGFTLGPCEMPHYSKREQ